MSFVPSIQPSYGIRQQFLENQFYGLIVITDDSLVTSVFSISAKVSFNKSSLFHNFSFNFFTKSVLDRIEIGQMHVLKVLCVAEKNDAAKNIASLLSRNNFSRREGFSKFNKIYEYKEGTLIYSAF